jgi:serine protease AprX
MVAKKRSSTPRADQKQSILRSVIVDVLLDPQQRERHGLPVDENVRLPILIELNGENENGSRGAADRLRQLWAGLDTKWPPLQAVSDRYYQVALSITEVSDLVWKDQATAAKSRRAIARVWPDLPVRPLSLSIYREAGAGASGLAARRSYSALGEGITWALLDSGIEASHPHFRAYKTLTGAAVSKLHRDFVTGDEANSSNRALTDKYGHGTHNAGIIAGGLPKRLPRQLRIAVAQGVKDPLVPSGQQYDPVSAEPDQLAAVAPRCQLVSCKVLDDDGSGHVSDVIRALTYIREELNDNNRLPRVHGVLVGLGYDYDPRTFACGYTPLCSEVDQLVRSGVVVVTPAGNTGFGTVQAFERSTQTGLMVTINDPGNAALAITVGSTARDSPHSFGVSFFSSKGPTADGRLKPDLVAPGERITSCAAGRLLELVYGKGVAPPKNEATYIDQTGTSCASAYVSGAIAAFLSVHREFIGRPEEVKRIFLDTATSLGREPYFQGRGMINLLRALQAV